MTLGSKIQEIRNARSMSQEQFGEMLNVSRQTVSKWELDQVIPDIRKIVAISRFFCVSLDDLLLNVTTFENDGIRFMCGVYRKDCSEIIETEKFALHYFLKSKHVMGVYVYEGNGNDKKIISAVEKDVENDTIRYIYTYNDEKGIKKTVGTVKDNVIITAENVQTPSSENPFSTQNVDYDLGYLLNQSFDRSVLSKMNCLEHFWINHGDSYIPTVTEAGIKQCLLEWRKGLSVYTSDHHFTINISTGKTEYTYGIQTENNNIYCGISYNIPFELGMRSYGQFYRLRNEGDNTAPYCQFFADFDYQMPQETIFAGEISLGQHCTIDNRHVWFVKQYENEKIVLAGCGGEEYIYERNDEKCERFVAVSLPL